MASVRLRWESVGGALRAIPDPLTDARLLSP